MGNLIEGFFIVLAAIIAFAVIVALIGVGIVIAAAITATIYTGVLPLSYLLTLVLLLSAEPSASDDPTEQRARTAEKGGRLEEGEPESGESGERVSFSVAPDRLAEELRQVKRGFLNPPHPESAWASAWHAKHKDYSIAKPSYFFGPVADDAEAIFWGYLERCWTCFVEGIDLVKEITGEGASPVGFVGAAGILIGLVVGGGAGLILTVILAVLHLVITVIVILGASLVCATLRLLDAIRRLVNRVRMPCPACHKSVVPYPTYLCPGCSERHRDIRPGIHGIAFRNCRCQVHFKTSLLIGAASLVAECPRCGARLPARFGVIPEIIIPFFGGLNAGKTQLMYTLVKTLHVLVTANGGSIEFEDDAEERLDRIGADLAAKGRPDKTLPEIPKAYILRVTLGLEQRLIFLYDAAGELHYSQAGLSQLNYLDKARVLVFVADPLAAEDLWAQIPEQSREELAKMRSTRAESERAYQLTREQMLRMGGKKKYARLALVVSKADVLEGAGIMSVPWTDECLVRDLMQRRRGLDLGDEIREATQGFAAVRFFHTAALIGDLELPDPSVERLALWLMRAEGFQLRQWMNNGA